MIFLTPLKLTVKNACIVAGVAQLVRAPVCGTGGRGFKTHRSPQLNLVYKSFIP